MKNKYYAIFGVVFLLLSLTGAIYLTFQNADNRNKAANKVCADIGNPRERQACAARNGGNMQGPVIPANEIVPCGNGAPFCNGCGGFCISATTLTCDQAIYLKCGEFPTRGSTITGIGSCSASSAGQSCNCSGTNVCFSNQGQCDNANHDGLCAVWAQRGSPKTMEELNNNSDYGNGSVLYFCKNRFLGQDGSSCTTAPPANFNIKCYCGTIQVDSGSGFKSQSMSCGCNEQVVDTPIPTPTIFHTPTPTPTGTRIPTRTPTPTFIIITDTPAPTPTGTYIPTDTPVPTDTLTPTNTPVPTSTPTGFYNTPTPTIYLAEGPSPTRIILPISGVEFPSQALTIIGGIATLLGFLILL